MKKNLFTTLIAIIALPLSVWSQGIRFEENHRLNDALGKAKTENKLIFIDAYASWCGPCKMMARDVFPQKKVGDYFNSHFINLKLDMEAAENLEIAKKYEVNVYPTYLFLNPGGEVVHRALGGMPAETLIEVAKTAGDSENNTMSVNKKIANGDRNYETLTKYFDANPYSDNNELLAVEYFETLTNHQKTDKEAWDIFNNYINNPSSAPFQYFLNNITVFETKFGKEALENKILNMFRNEYYSNNENFENLKSIHPSLFEKAKTMIRVKETYTKFRKDNNNEDNWKIFMKVAAPYLSKQTNNPMELNNMAWFVYENYKKFDDKKALKSSLEWAKKAYTLAPEKDFIADTYAHILFDLNKKKEAIEIEEEALEIATKNNDTQSIITYKKTIDEFKK